MYAYVNFKDHFYVLRSFTILIKRRITGANCNGVVFQAYVIFSVCRVTHYCFAMLHLWLKQRNWLN